MTPTRGVPFPPLQGHVPVRVLHRLRTHPDCRPHKRAVALQRILRVLQRLDVDRREGEHECGVAAEGVGDETQRRHLVDEWGCGRRRECVL